MKNKDLKKQIMDNNKTFVVDVMKSLKKDPSADEHTLNYNETEEYLFELIERDGSLLNGIIHALECYLEK